MSESSEKEIMLDTLEHCRVNMALSEVQAYAGKWTQRDEDTMGAIRRLIEKMGEWQKRMGVILATIENGFEDEKSFASMYMRLMTIGREIRDFGKEGR